MKTKILIAGIQDTIIDDFFMHTANSFTCMTTSERVEDVKIHIQLFEPDVFVYCAGRIEKNDIDVIREVKSLLNGYNCAIVTIGDKPSMDNLQSSIDELVDLFLIKPISIFKIQTNIENLLEDRRIAEEVRIREEQKRNEQLLKEQQDNELASKKHILVVDDDPVMLRTIKHYLEEKYIVATAPSGKFAVKFLALKHTDLVLLDYEMPEMSGPEVFQEIKEMKKNNDVPVVFLTGISDTSKIKSVLAMQPKGYLLKPVDYERLHTTIDGILGKEE